MEREMEIKVSLNKQECMIALKAVNAFRQKNAKEQKRSERKGMFPEEGRANIYEVHKTVIADLGVKFSECLKQINKEK